MNIFQDSSYNKSFSQLAKESNFTFNLYRGRVDWRKLEVLDVDRLVRDQDVEMLNIHVSSITGCHLETEYDVKILDPNFIKLFRLAQLLIDFLLHCKRYLEHCIKVAHEGLHASNKEVEFLRKQLQARKYEVKQLKKKMKEVKHQLLLSPRFSGPSFECSTCGKMFVSEAYLQVHHSRTHRSQPPSQVQTVQEERSQIKKSEDINNVKKKYQEEIEDLKSMFFAEIKKLKQNEVFNKQTDVQSINNIIFNTGESQNNRSNETNAVKECKDTGIAEEETVVDPKVQPQSSVKEKSATTSQAKIDSVSNKEWLHRLEERESVWRTRLSALDQQHKTQVRELQQRLDSVQLQGQEIKKELEVQLEEALKKFEQCQSLSYSQKEHDKLTKDILQDLSLTKEQEESPLQPENKTILHNENIIKQPPPFQKRRAFVSQKSKTVQEQDSFETSPPIRQPAENLVKLLDPDNESESEIARVETQNIRKGEQDYTSILGEKKFPSFDQAKEASSRSRNKESIITKLLEEEKLKSIANKSHESRSHLVEDDTSITETLSETESESSEEKQDTRISGLFDPRQTSEDQLLRTETHLAQQSLQSMEALLESNPTILQQLREDLQHLLGRRLQQQGVDPGWTSLPPATFRAKMATLTHQRQITAKKHKFYFTLRDKLSKDADDAVSSRPTQSTADSLLARLRKKAAQVISAAKFTSSLGVVRKQDSPLRPDLFQNKNPHPLASSSPKVPDSAFIIPKIQSTLAKDSLSLSSSTYDDGEDEEPMRQTQPTATPDVVSYKSALRNAVSTGNLTKKKVLFVDEALKDTQRSQSEHTVAGVEDLTHRLGSASVASLVHNIQHQLSQRNPKPAHSVDLMKSVDLTSSLGTGKPALNAEDSWELPLSQILPLSKSGRELLESELVSSSKKSPVTLQSSTNPSPLEKTSPRNLEPIGHILQKVPLAKSSPLPSLKPAPRSLLQSPKMSPAHSLSSLNSSLFDISVSPRGTQATLEWDLQDLEENLKD